MLVHERDPVFRRAERQPRRVVFERRQRDGAVADVLIRPFADFLVELRLFIDADVPGGFIRFFTRLVSYGCPVEAVLKTVRDEKSDVELAEMLGADLAKQFGLED